MITGSISVTVIQIIITIQTNPLPSSMTGIGQAL
jgi:hypothetical protein